MHNCKQPKPITDSVTTPMPLTRRQVQALVRQRHTMEAQVLRLFPVFPIPWVYPRKDLPKVMIYMPHVILNDQL